jgi:hypothetical protein
MKMRLWSGGCVAIAFALTVGLLAQAQPPTSSSQPTAPSASAKSISVTGCVQRTEQAPTGTTGTAGATRSSISDTKFLLTNAAIGTSSSSSTAGTAGTAGALPSTAVATEYRLDADDAKLTPHVGHKVEISGTVEQPSASTSASPSATTQPPAASAANAPKLKVESVKMVASSCP